MRLDPRPLRRRLAAILLGLGALLWLLACGESGAPGKKLAGGTGSEAGDAYGLVWSVGKERAAVAAHVSLYLPSDSEFTHPTLKSETETDSAGRFHLEIKQAGDYDLELRDAAGNEILYQRGCRLPAKGDTNLGTFQLPEAARYRGKLTSKPASPTRLWLEGTPYSALADSAGAFAFPALPPGSFVLFSERNVGDTLARVVLGTLELHAGDSIAPPDSVPPDTIPRDTIPRDSIPRDTIPSNHIDSTVTVQPYSGPGEGTSPIGAFSIEDFSDGGEQSTWGAGHGGCLWSSRTAGQADMSPATGAFDINTTATNGYKGRTLTVAYRAIDSAGRAIVELSMDPLSSILQQGDTLVFHAKGGGKLRVDLNLDFGDVSVKSAAGLIALSGTAFSEYHLALATGPRTGAVANYIRFSGYGGFGFWLDDIELRPKR